MASCTCGPEPLRSDPANCPIHGTARALTAAYGDPPAINEETDMPANPYLNAGFEECIVPPDRPTTRSPGRAERVRDIILKTAAQLISGDRERDYGSAITGFTRTGKLWAAILGVEEITAEQVALCMTALKISRLCESSNHQESWIDGCGYLALGGDIAATPGRYP